MDDDVIGDLTKEDLVKVGFATGNAIKCLKAFAVLSPAPTSVAGAASASPAAGGGAASHVVSSSSTSSSPPLLSTPPSSLAKSNFKRLYDAGECPELQHQLFSSMHSFIMGICDIHSVPAAAGKELFHRQQGESFENPRGLLSQVKVGGGGCWKGEEGCR